MRYLIIILASLILVGCGGNETAYKDFQKKNSSYQYTALAKPLIKYRPSVASAFSTNQRDANEGALKDCETRYAVKCILEYENNAYVLDKHLGKEESQFWEHYNYCSKLNIDLTNVVKCSVERRSNTLKMYDTQNPTYGNYFDNLLLDTADKFSKKQISENEAKLLLTSKILELQKQIQASMPIVVYQDAPGVDWNRLNEIWRGQGSVGGVPTPTTRCTSRRVGNTVVTDCY